MCDNSLHISNKEDESNVRLISIYTVWVM